MKKKVFLLVSIFILVFSGFSFALDVPDTIPEGLRPKLYDLDYDFFVFRNDDGGYRLYEILSGGGMSRTPKNDGYYDGVIIRYYSTNGTSWIEGGTGNILKDTSTILYSTLDLYDSATGKVFFSGPKGLRDIVEEETMKIPRALLGKMKMILPVGFGLLSALVLVKLLTVYFRRYLHRSMS